jgi:hypothetical protein
MSKAGDTIENPVTEERIVVRVGTKDSGDAPRSSSLSILLTGARRRALLCAPFQRRSRKFILYGLPDCQYSQRSDPATG